MTLSHFFRLRVSIFTIHRCASLRVETQHFLYRCFTAGDNRFPVVADHHHGDQPEVHRGGEQGDRAAERLTAARAGQPQPVAHQQLSQHPASTHGKKSVDCTFRPFAELET